jgi:hypothetical protein
MLAVSQVTKEKLDELRYIYCENAIMIAAINSAEQGDFTELKNYLSPRERQDLGIEMICLQPLQAPHSRFSFAAGDAAVPVPESNPTVEDKLLQDSASAGISSSCPD